MGGRLIALMRKEGKRSEETMAEFVISLKDADPIRGEATAVLF